jgi:hypothetical protein
VGLAIPAAATCSPYEAVLGEAFALLHANVRRAHLSPLHAAGTLDVEHGPGWFVHALIRVMKLPAAGVRQRVELEVGGSGSELIWTRRIGDVILETRQRASGSRVVERSGLGRVSFDLSVDDGALVYRQSAVHLAGLRVPASVSPRVRARVSPATHGWRVAVTVTWRERMVCRYAGTVAPS